MRLIDADALKKYVKQQEDYDSSYTICAYIDNAPTIKTFTLLDIEEQYRKGLEKGLSEWETERPQGEWINHGIINTCSICNCDVLLTITDKVFNGEVNFCLNCGSEMKKRTKTE